MAAQYLRELSSGSSDDEESNTLFNVAIATIFAREVLEGCIIIGQYRTVIQKSDYMTDDRKTELLKIVTRSATLAAIFAIVVVIIVAIPLAILSNELDERVVEIIEGFSKVVAAICIVQLSVKIPGWLNIYKKVSILPWKKYDPKKGKKDVDGLSNKEVKFNVAWNIWREVAECGVFLLPFFLASDNLKAIPISALVGTALALIVGVGIYVANNRLTKKFWLAFTMSGLTLFLSVGLFVGGCHEFEEVWGETKKVWKIQNSFFSHKEFPFVLLKPFGWSSSRTVLQITCFWCWLALGCLLHFLKWRKTQQVKAMYPEEQNDDNDTPEVVKDVDDDVEAGVSSRNSTNEEEDEDEEEPVVEEEMTA